MMSDNVDKTTEEPDLKRNEDAISVVKAKRRKRKLPKCVRFEEFISLVKAVPQKDRVARIGFLLAYGAGMRVSEVLRCEKEHFRKTSIFVPESKYGVERVVPRPKGWKDSFFKHLPLKTTARTLERKFKKYAKLSKLPSYYTFHSLRHGFATRMLEVGTPINQVQVLMGHSNIATTSIYLKANPIDAIKSYEDLF